MKKIIVISVIALSFSVYLAFALPSLHRPLVADDHGFIRAAMHPPSTEFLWHPPLYTYLLKAMVEWFKLTNENLRLFGVFCSGLDLILIYFLSQSISKDRKTGFLACFLFATHPLAIQGSLILDIDNTILTFLSMLFILYFGKVYRRKISIHDFFSGFLFFVLLWSKLTTPLILIFSVFLFYLFKGEIRTACVRTALTGGIGAALFIFTWLLYAHIYNLPYLVIFKRSLLVFEKGLGGTSLPVAQEFAARVVKVTLWLGPYFILFWLIVLILRVRNYLHAKFLELEDFYLIFISLVLIAYTLVGGTHFGFAKYHYVILPLLAVLAANSFFELAPQLGKKNILLCVITSSVFILLARDKVGDLIYRVNYLLREVVIFFPQKTFGFVLDFIYRVGLYLFPFALGLLIVLAVDKRKGLLKSAILLLLTLTFTADLTLAFTQLNAPYITTSCYGRSLDEMRQTENFLKRLQEKFPGGIIIAPEDIAYNAGAYQPKYRYHTLWDNREEFIEAIKDKKVICIAWGLTWNAVYTYKNVFFDQEVQRLLRKDYLPLKLGSFSLWLRKGKGAEDLL